MNRFRTSPPTLPAPAEPARVADLFDTLSGVYDHDRNEAFYAGLARRMAENVFAHTDLGPDASCLDLACGTGISTAAAVEVFPCAEWSGADQSAEMLAVAASKPALRRVRFEQAPGDALPFFTGEFDWILCNVAYHWLPPSAASEIERVLAPGGLVSLMVPLVSPSGDGGANRWLARVLMRFASQITPLRSQGLTLPQVTGELSALTISRAEIITVEEEFASTDELLETLFTRSSLQAIFGPLAGEVADRIRREPLPVPEDLRFCWNFALVEARKPDRD